MTPNPHRGSDFADFLAEEGLMTPTPRTDAAIAASDGQWSFVLRDLAQEMEQQLAANHEAIKLMCKWLEDERALADGLSSALTDSATWSHALPAYEAWKKARKS